MNPSAPDDDPDGGPRKLEEQVGGKATRKLRARQQKASVWFGFGLFGIIGWSVAIPTLLGIALGLWIDRHWPGRASWTLTLMFVGLVIGCFNAWHWVKREGRGP